MRIQTWLCMCSCMKNHWTCPWKPSDEQKAKAEDVSQKFIPKDIVWYLIYAYRPDSYQADHIFEHIINTKGEKILQAIFCIININTRYAFAEPVDYTRNIKKQDQLARNDKRKQSCESQEQWAGVTCFQTYIKKLVRGGSCTEHLCRIPQSVSIPNSSSVYRWRRRVQGYIPTVLRQKEYL